MANVDADLLAQLLQQLTTATTARINAPRAINCRNFRMGESWGDFKTYFMENVRASHQLTLPADRDRLERACCSFLPTKLDPGPTLTAYDQLDNVVKNNWADLDTALNEAFSNEAEKEAFLANTSAFKRGNKGLMEYKNELIKLLDMYLPNLKTIRDEYQREATKRFIEGLDDQRLQRKLREHCRRDRRTIDEAYTRAVDYEASERESEIREGEVAALTGAMPAEKRFSTLESPMTTPKILVRPTLSGAESEFKLLRNEVKAVAERTKVNEFKIQEIMAKETLNADRMDIFKNEVFEKLDRIQVNQTRLPSSTAFPHPSYPFPAFPYPRYPRPMAPRGMGPNAPGLTGGRGFVNNMVRPNLLNE